jgi:serine-type D-Ala-D-Ala carboxypeptidase/endopeptidase
MFIYDWQKRLMSSFVVIILCIIIVASPTITSVLASPPLPTTNLSIQPITSSVLISAQEEENNSSSTFKITDQIKRLINALVDKNKTNAAIAIGFIDLNGTQFYGHGKISNTNTTTVDQNTIFAIGSITKVFTTTLLADMVNQGLIKLNDPIERYLPSNIKLPQYRGHKITIEDLATHTSGLPNFPSNYCPSFDPTATAFQHSIQYRTNLMNCTKNYTFDNFYQALSNTTLSREQGSKFEYSNFGIGLLGHILTLKSNMSSYDELLSTRILDVLDMNSTSIGLSDAQKSRLAIGHFNGGQELPTWNASNPMAPGPGLHSSVSDMLKFLSANMGLVKTKLGDAMQEAHLIRHSTNQLLPNNEPASFHTDSFNTDKLGFYVGLGWMIATNFGQEIVWHSGSTPDGYNAFMVFNPTKQKGIVILCSADTSNINISDIIFKQNNNLSSVIGNLLNE